jgi:hypothetical protein
MGYFLLKMTALSLYSVILAISKFIGVKLDWYLTKKPTRVN